MDNAQLPQSGPSHGDRSLPMASADAIEAAEADRAAVDLLFQRISELETRANQADKRWYRTPSIMVPIIVSVLALVASVAIPVIQEQATRTERKQEKVNADLKALGSLVGQIVDLRAQNTKMLASSSNLQLFQAESSYLNAKKIVKQDQAITLLSDPEIRSKADPNIVTVLAVELAESGEIDKAKQFLESVLKRKDIRGWPRAYASASLAYLELRPHANSSEIADAQSNLQGAVNWYKRQTGEYPKQELVETYLSWANQEFFAHKPAVASAKLHLAQLWLSHLSPLDGYRRVLENSYLAEDHLISDPMFGLSASATNEAADPGRWSGIWEMRIANGSNKSGPLILSWNKMTNLIDARMDLFADHTLVGKYAGSCNLFGTKLLRVDWMDVIQTAIVRGYPPRQTVGYSVLRLDGANRLIMKTYLLGEVPMNGNGRRASASAVFPFR